jgi:hypothetical protein
MNGISVSVLAALIVLTLLSTIIVLRLSGERRAHDGYRRHKLRHTIAANRSAAIPITPWNEDEDACIEVREYDSAVDAAEVLLEVGNAHGAAEVLSQFIEAHPKEAVAPWLSLLDIYRKAGAKDEYDTLAGRLTQHFNVHVLPWHQSSLPSGGPGLEAYPHVVEALMRRWGTRACRHYLGKLIADNRGGSRGGFSAETLDDILLLTVILDAIHIASPDPAAEHPHDKDSAARRLNTPARRDRTREAAGDYATPSRAAAMASSNTRISPM